MPEQEKDTVSASPSAGSGPEVGSGEQPMKLAVRGGEVVAVVPSGTAEEDAIAQATVIRGALRLENERVLNFEVRRDARGATFEDASAALQRRQHAADAAARSRVSGMGLTAGDIMTRDVLTANPDMLVEDIAKLLAFHNITGMPVEDWSGRVVGVISEADVIGKLGVTVDEVMSTDVISVSQDTPIQEIATLMTDRRIRRVPVLSNGSLVGIVSRADIVRALAG